MAASRCDPPFEDRKDLVSMGFSNNALGLSIHSPSIPSLNETYIDDYHLSSISDQPLTPQDTSSPQEFYSPYSVRPYLSQLDTGIGLAVSPSHRMGQKDLVPFHATQSSPVMIRHQPSMLDPHSGWTSNYSYSPSPMVSHMPMNPASISPHQLSPFLPSPASQYSASSPYLHPLTPLSACSSITGESPRFNLYQFPPTPSVSHPSPLLSSPPLNDDPYGPHVPQTIYRPPTASDRRRYIDDVQLEPPVLFETNQCSCPGFSLGDALKSYFINLKGRDDLMFVNRGPSISIRLQWTGYQAWSRQIPTRDFKTPPGPITRSKLSRSVAKSIQRFIEEQTETQVEPAHATWQVGPGHITIDDLILVQLRHVSMGSWQAELRLKRMRL